LRTDEPKRKILSVKAQAENFFARLEKINGNENSLRELVDLYAEPRLDFELLVENLSRIVSDAQRRVNFFAANKNIIACLVKAHGAWSDDYKAFKTTKRETLKNICDATGIYWKIPSAWYKDWQTKRFAIEQNLLPLFEFVLKGNLRGVVERVLNVLDKYRAAVEDFYLNERKNIYMQISNAAGSNEQDRLEKDIRLFQLTETFQRDLLEIIFACDKSEERIFLLHWAKPLLDLPIDELSKFISDRKLDAMSQEILMRFYDLKKQNYEQFLADNKTADQALKQRNAKINELLFSERVFTSKK